MTQIHTVDTIPEESLFLHPRTDMLVIKQPILTVKRVSLRDHLASLTVEGRKALAKKCRVTTQQLFAWRDHGYPDEDSRAKYSTALETLKKTLGFEAVLIPFDEAQQQTDEATWNLLINRMPLPFPWSSRKGRRNRVMSAPKIHAALNSALWYRDFFLDDLGYTNSQLLWITDQRKDITARDYERAQGLRNYVADPETQYWDPKADRDGTAPLNGIDMDTASRWVNSSIMKVEDNKKANRQRIGAFNFVPFTHVPFDITVKYWTQEKWLQHFSQLPQDGDIPVTGAFRQICIESKSGWHMRLQTGDKLRGIRDVAFKGSITFIPPEERPNGKGLIGHEDPIMYLVEGASLKMDTRGQSFERTYSAQDFLGVDPPFAVETPSVEARTRPPKVSGHIWQSLITRARRMYGDAEASTLVPQLSDHLLKLLAREADPIDYMEFCIFPVDGYSFDKDLILSQCQLILDGTVILDVNQPQISVVADDIEYRAGVRKEGFRILRGDSPFMEDIWSYFDRALMNEVYKELHPRFPGVGAKLKLNPTVPHGFVFVSRIVAEELPDELGECAGIYWPQKNVTCLMRYKIAVDTSLDGRVIMINPDMAEGQTSDGDGDYFFLITDPKITYACPRVDEDVEVVDGFSGEVKTYTMTTPSMTLEGTYFGGTYPVDVVQHHGCPALELISEVRNKTHDFLQEQHDILAANTEPEQDWHLRMCQVNDQARAIGKQFIERDIICDWLQFDPVAEIALGELAHVQLSGLKIDNPINIPTYIIGRGSLVSFMINQPMHKLPYYEDGTSVFRPSTTYEMPHEYAHYLRQYRLFSRRIWSVKEAISDSHDSNAMGESIFDFFCAHTNMAIQQRKNVITYEKLAHEATQQALRLEDEVGDPQYAERLIKHARGIISQTGKRFFTEDGQLVDEGPYSARSCRWWRARFILDNCKVNLNALRVAVLQYSAKYKRTEMLGVLAAMKVLQEKEQEKIREEIIDTAVEVVDAAPPENITDESELEFDISDVEAVSA
jgi:hypothetical protein